MHTSRRQLLALSAAAAQSLWMPRSAWSQPRLPRNPFGLGVASGSATAEGVVLWTRLLSIDRAGPSPLPRTPITVRWELAHDDGFQKIVRQGQTEALPQLGHSVHVELDGLEPARWYHYRFLVGGAGTAWVSPSGRTRTLPAPDAVSTGLRLVYASCQRWEHGHYAAWTHAAAEAPDAIVFLGDYIYEYPGAVNAVRKHNDGWALTLDDYRRRYALYRSDPALQAAHQACPWFVVWDDHEVQNDYAGLSAGDAGPEVAEFAARRAAAYQAFYEHMPLRSSVLTRALEGLTQGADLRLHGHVSLGRLGSLTLLDTRQHKSPQACTRNGQRGASTVIPRRCKAWRDPDRSMLGQAQEAWLDRVMQRTPREAWNLFAQPTLFGQRNLRTAPDQMFSNDGWDGYEPARDRLLAGLQRHRVANPVMLGGDVHQNWVGHIKSDYDRPRSANVGVEFCGTAISSRSGGNSHTQQRLADNPHFVFADAELKGYGVVDLQARRLTTTLRVVDDVTRADSPASTLAQFVVHAGKPQIERL
jgi:alkaline phosphatase D